MVLAPGRLAVAGPPDLGRKDPNTLSFENPAEALAGFEGDKDIYLRILSAADGGKLSETKLPVMPVFDGMSAAGGCLFLSLRNGAVACYGR